MRHAIASLVLALLAALAPRPVAAQATPDCPRVPQVAFASAALQAKLDSLDGGVHVLASQLDAPEFLVWDDTRASLYLQVRAHAQPANTAVGLYLTDGSSNILQLPVLPAGLSPGWSAVVDFQLNGFIVVSLYDDTYVFQGSSLYPGRLRQYLGFYVQRDGVTYWQSDARNGGVPQALVYAATGANVPDEWVCFATSPYTPVTSTYTDVVLDVNAERVTSSGPVNWLRLPCIATPARRSTWGALKAAYR